VRIVHLITRGDVGGAQTHVVELASAQRDRGDRVTIITGVDGPAMERARSSGVVVAVVPELGPAGRSSRSRRWGRGALAELRRALRALDPDVVHGHSSSAGLLARLAARREGWPSVYTAHGWPFQRGAPLRQRVTSYAAELIGGRVGDAVICLTEAERRRAERARVAPADRMWVIPNAIADVTPELRWTADQHPVRLIMVARFAPPKLQSRLIDALAPLLDLAWTIEFVGDGPQLEQTRLRGQELLGARAEFPGHADDVAQRLSTSDVFVLWSAYEGMPISMLEAMRAGLCCVGSDVPGVEALMGDPPVGLICSDLAQLEAALRMTISDAATRRRLGELARARFESTFSIAAMEAATRQVYESVRSR
jgi:glycosyltransferase involved in cell wall biosynthesis